MQLEKEGIFMEDTAWWVWNGVFIFMEHDEIVADVRLCRVEGRGFFQSGDLFSLFTFLVWFGWLLPLFLPLSSVLCLN